MTEQPVETEQEGFLGNPATAPAQAYLPNGHRTADLHLSLSKPFDHGQALILMRKLVHAEAAHKIAKAESAKAEDALHLALGVESEAADRAQEAANALRKLAQKAANQ